MVTNEAVLRTVNSTISTSKSGSLNLLIFVIDGQVRRRKSNQPYTTFEVVQIVFKTMGFTRWLNFLWEIMAVCF